MATVEVVSALTPLPVKKLHESVKIDHLEVVKNEDVVESWSPPTPDNVVLEEEGPQKEETTDHDVVARVAETPAGEVDEKVVVEEATKDVVVTNIEEPNVVTDNNETKADYNKVAPEQPEPVVLNHDETKTANSDEPPKEAEAEAEHVESAVEVPKEDRVVEEEEKFVEAENNVEIDAPTEKNE